MIKSTNSPKIFFILIDFGFATCITGQILPIVCVCRWLMVVKFQPGSLQLGWSYLLITSILLLRLYYSLHACLFYIVQKHFPFCRQGNHLTHQRIEESIFSDIYCICIHTRFCIAELISSSSCLPFCQTENMLIIKKALLILIVFLKVVFSLEAIRELITSPFSVFCIGSFKDGATGVQEIHSVCM